MAYAASNAKKYHTYRQRFFDNFVTMGQSDGDGIPFAHREATKERSTSEPLSSPDIVNNPKSFLPNSPNTFAAIISSGETTHAVGVLAGWLASEFVLFRRTGLDTTDTIEKLFLTLWALNRIDMNSETFEGKPGGPPNGYMVRHDYPNAGLATTGEAELISDTHPLNTNAVDLETLPQAQASSDGQFVLGSGKAVQRHGLAYPSRRCERGELGERPNKTPPFTYTHCPFSRDHIISILWGLKLVFALMPDGVTNGNKPFQDGVTDIREEAARIFDRIMTYLEKNNYTIRTSFGDKPIGDNVGQLGTKGQLRTGWNQIQQGNIGPTNSYYFSPPALGQFAAQMNKRMFLKTQNIAGNAYKLWPRSNVFGHEMVIMNYHLLVNNGSLPGSDIEQLFKTTEFYLNTAPCDGPFNHNPDDYAAFGWQVPDRLDSSHTVSYLSGLVGQKMNGQTVQNVLDVNPKRGNFYGLDYLLLHNLYFLNAEKIRKLTFAGPSSAPPCTGICDEFDPIIAAIEKTRVKAELDRNMWWYINKCIRKKIKNCVDAAVALRNDQLAQAQTWRQNRLAKCPKFWLFRKLCQAAVNALYGLMVAAISVLFALQWANCQLIRFSTAARQDCRDKSGYHELVQELDKMQSLCP